MIPTSEPPPEVESGRTGKALPLRLGAQPAAAALPVQSPREAERAPRTSLNRVGLVLGAVFVLVLATGLFAAWALPRYVRQACIEQAAAHGIVLSINGATFGAGGFRLLGAAATFPDVPGVHARAPEIDIETSGLVPKTMTAHGAELFLDGPWDMVDTGFAQWRASPRGGQSGTWAPAKMTAVESRVVWQHAFGEKALLTASDVRLEASWRYGRAEVQAASDHVTVDVPGGRLGPWAVHLDRTLNRSRLRVALDPDVPDSCTILMIAEGNRMTALDAAVRRSPVSRLGLPTAVLGLQGDDVQLETTIHYTTLGPQRVDATVTGALYGVSMGAAFGGHPISVAWEGTTSGDPTVGADVRKARLAVGPLVGPVTGTLKAFEGGGFRVDSAWTGGPVPCAALDVPLGPGQPFEIGYTLRTVAEAASRRHLKGEISARTELALDSRDLLNSHIEFLPNGHCPKQ